LVEKEESQPLKKFKKAESKKVDEKSGKVTKLYCKSHPSSGREYL